MVLDIPSPATFPQSTSFFPYVAKRFLSSDSLIAELIPSNEHSKQFIYDIETDGTVSSYMSLIYIC